MKLGRNLAETWPKLVGLSETWPKLNVTETWPKLVRNLAETWEPEAYAKLGRNLAHSATCMELGDPKPIGGLSEAYPKRPGTYLAKT